MYICIYIHDNIYRCSIQSQWLLRQARGPARSPSESCRSVPP